MATIVQPYNPWREQLAANLLGPILGNIIQQGQQRADNAYNNKIAGQFMDAVSSMSAAQQPETPSNFLSLGMTQQQPSNGWESVFRQGNNELAKFDMAMNPLFSAQTARPRALNQVDMQSALMRTLAGSRADPKAIHAIVDPYIQSMEAQRINDMRSDYASKILGANNWDDRFMTSMAGNIEGVVSDSALGTMSNYGQFRQPHQQFSTVNAGDKQVVLAQDPATGNTRNVLNLPMGLNPNTTAEINARRDIATMENDTTRRGQDLVHDIQERTLTMQEAAQKYQQEHPEHKPITGIDGKIYFYNPIARDGKVIQGVDENGQPITDSSILSKLEIKQDASGNYFVINPYERIGQPITDQNENQIKGALLKNSGEGYATKEVIKSELKGIENREKNLEAQLGNLRIMLSMATYDGETEVINGLQQQIQDIENKLAQLSQDRQRLTNPQGNTPAAPPASPDVPAPVSNDAQLAVPMGVTQQTTKQATPPEKSPAPAETDIVNHSTPEAIQGQIDNLNGNTSNDARPAFTFSIPSMITPDISPNMPSTIGADNQPQTMPEPLPPQNNDPRNTVSLKNLPRDFIYDATKHGNMTADKVFETIDDFKNKIAEIMNRNPELTANTAVYELYKYGYKINLQKIRSKN